MPRPRRQKQPSQAASFRQTRQSLRSTVSGDKPFIFNLPTEVLQLIAVETYNASLATHTRRATLAGPIGFNRQSFRDVLHLAQACRRWRNVGENVLYKLEALCDPQFQVAIGWAAFHGKIGTLEKALSVRETPSIKYSINDHVAERCHLMSRPAAVFFLEPSQRPIEHPLRQNPRDSSPPYATNIAPYLEPVPYLEPWILPTLKGIATALHIACATGQDEVVEYLIKKGADINIGSNVACSCRSVATGYANPRTPPSLLSYRTPLHTAICYDRTAIATLLLRLGASTDIENPPTHAMKSQKYRVRNDGETALHSACWTGNLELVRHIIENKYQTDIDQEDAHGSTALHYAFTAGHHKVLVPWLMDHGADIDHPVDGGSTLLQQSLNSSARAKATKLVELGADQKKALVTGGSFGNGYPIQVAMRGCGPEDLKLFRKCLEREWDPNFKDENGRSLLFNALVKGCQKRVRFLLNAGATRKIVPDLDGVTPLIAACERLTGDDLHFCCSNRVGMLNTVLGFGITVNHISSPRDGSPGKSALGILVATQLGPLIGTEPNYRSTLPPSIRQDNLKTCMRILLSKGADPNARLDGTPILLASFNAHGPAFCGLLLRAGASSPKDEEMDQMLDKALEEDHEDRFNFVLELDGQHKRISSGEIFRTAIREHKFRVAHGYLKAGLSPISEDMPNALLQLCSASTACRSMREPVIIEIIDRGDADINAVNENGECALLLAVKHNLSDCIIEKLVAQGADVNLQPANHPQVQTPLHFAVEKSQGRNISHMVDCSGGFAVGTDVLPCNKFIIHEYLSPRIVYSGHFSPQIVTWLHSVSDPLALDENGDTAYSICLRHASESISRRWGQFKGLPCPYTRLIFKKRREVPWEQKNKDGKSLITYLEDIHRYVKKHQARSLSLFNWLDAFFKSYILPQFLGGGRLPLHSLRGNPYYFTIEDPGGYWDEFSEDVDDELSCDCHNCLPLSDDDGPGMYGLDYDNYIDALDGFDGLPHHYYGESDEDDGFI
ncbi:ankyrin [Zalerion maritima]|uniref:Ankyrin n=1 Tax=Zalerion maritima TaxID=339359 RepID=A0AAD5RVB9_9PEZI|nr:ankyrin [Zalerion maritima]